MNQIKIQHKHDEVTGWYEVEVKIDSKFRCKSYLEIKKEILDAVDREINYAIEQKLRADSQYIEDEY